jgi:hypothetical protein
MPVNVPSRNCGQSGSKVSRCGSGKWSLRDCIAKIVLPQHGRKKVFNQAAEVVLKQATGENRD